jgi:UDP-2,4-diacetamido-2,4,6-trideoxy-beta-L-altropyranose hydrolase
MALRAKGASVFFLSRLLPGHYCNWLEERGFDVVRLPAPVNNPVQPGGLCHDLLQGEQKKTEIEEASAALKQLGEMDWLIVDHYALDAEWEGAMRVHARKIMVIDDLANRKHDADLLLDQNLQTYSGRYDNLLPATCVQLLGPKFALLRSEFTYERNRLPPRNGNIRRILIFMGGGDVRNVTGKVLEAVSSLEIQGLGVDVVLTHGNPFYQELCALSAQIPNCTIHVQTAEMATLMANADLMVGGSGSASWERCCLGLPSILISIAENQREIGRTLADRHAAFYLGDDENVQAGLLRSLIARLTSHPGLLRAIGKRASNLVDGRGVDRVAAALLRNHRVTVISDQGSWINEHLPAMVACWRKNGYVVDWVHDAESIQQGDCAFFLSFSKIVGSEILSRSAHNLVVHESDLPSGRGWSPLTWQIIEGKNRIPVTLIEAESAVDSGDIYGQEYIQATGGELIDELREMQADATIRLCSNFLRDYPAVITKSRKQVGPPSYYPRRVPQDSQIDPNRSIAEQFNLLRVVDNKRYPAWFEWAGRKYLLRIENAENNENGLDA